MLDIQTYDAKQGGNVLYKALAHPLVAERVARLGERLGDRTGDRIGDGRTGNGRLAVFDPEGQAAMLWALHPLLPRPATVFVQDVALVGREMLGGVARPMTAMMAGGFDRLLVAAFDAGRVLARMRHLVPDGVEVLTLDEARLPPEMLGGARSYLDRLNFATNYAFFRDEGGLSTRLVTANYWASYGARSVRLWLRLFDRGGAVLAEWQQPVPEGPGGIVIDSREVRKRFELPAFTGQLFLHAIGVAGHDVVKYALDTYDNGEGGGGSSLSVTHDANAWPSDRYANLPAPRADERVVVWIQNSHGCPIPAGAITLDRMGAEAPVAVAETVPPYASIAVDVDALLPGLRWPAQVELRAGRHVVRPRYEISRGGRRRIAHLNVERADLRPDPGIPELPAELGRGYLLPFPVLDPKRFRTVVQPTPMAERQVDLPLRLDVFDVGGAKVAERFLGRLSRNHDTVVDLDELGAPEGHADLVYDFRDGGSADGWMHALVRYEDRNSGHVAESSFGAHIFNTAMTYRDEPQSYAGPPPGLSTRLFLRVGDRRRRSFSALIYPASAAWHPFSTTTLMLHDAAGVLVEEAPIRLACSGSMMVWPHEHFAEAMLERAGEGAYVIIRDTTCRLFGYHGLMDEAGAFSLDHMFGF